jgi:hypothetical protein
MCFSMTASFATGVGLTAVGLACLRRYASRRYFFLAAIPLLFGIQQLSEGFVWLKLNQPEMPFSLSFFQSLYLFIALIIWPIWIPLSLLMIEKIVWRKACIGLLLGLGLILADVNLMQNLHYQFTSQIVKHSIQYDFNVADMNALYPFIVLAPCFFSSSRHFWIFGLLTTIAFFIAAYLYAETFTSLWCFFAAVISLLVYRVIRKVNG